jgi:hypothetical protein
MAKKRRAASKKTRPMTLTAYLGAIKEMHAASADAQKGACFIKDPQTGETRCIRTSPEACKALGGTYVGGPCG